MGDVAITRRNPKKIEPFKNELVTEIITLNTLWTVPRCMNNEISVRMIGSGYNFFNDTSKLEKYSSGWMNNEVFNNLIKDQQVQISIIPNGATTFGDYLSANGASEAGGGAGGRGCIGYQFGGGSGGAGGVWGGGGGAESYYYDGNRYIGSGKNGGTYGGGGGGHTRIIINNNGTGITNSFSAGNGGTYGGGGGGACSNTNSRYVNMSASPGIGGTYGGNGGVYNYNGYTGTNTSTWTNVFNDGNGYFRGWGKGGTYYSIINGGYNANGGGGGGGFGGNGGMGNCDIYIPIRTYDKRCNAAGGGGGGYGSNGGDADQYQGTTAGGGGGYGGDGGTGGGGGYGKVSKGGASGGGGYYCPSGYGAGGYGIWDGNNNLIKAFGCGGEGNDIRLNSGVCVIQYYI